MSAPSRRPPRWLRRSLVALPIVFLVLLLGACGSAMYVHAIWERAVDQCGLHAQSPATGWHIEFDGGKDVFVCEYRRNEVRRVGQRELAPEEYMGSSGSWPVFSDLIAYELEAIDGDEP
jgi:hypothetical protein